MVESRTIYESNILKFMKYNNILASTFIRTDPRKGRVFRITYINRLELLNNEKLEHLLNYIIKYNTTVDISISKNFTTLSKGRHSVQLSNFHPNITIFIKHNEMIRQLNTQQSIIFKD